VSRSRHPSLTRLQNRLAAVLGCGVEQRRAVIAAMLRRGPTETTGYWLQLFVAVGIATMGLVLGSTAVVIGAMLIAPLMGPIVSFGMGLAVGSPFLVLRSGVRILMSIIVAVGSSSVITLLLPFHDLNAEIAARTTPTVLDLLTASFCALAGVYASMRPGSDVASTAAGTSIGISLVPPLCASGYGVATADWNVAGGAALLFLTNLVAIVLVGTLSFSAAGFNQVDIVTLEDELQQGGTPPMARSRLDRRLQGLFASRSGPWLRLLMPFALLAAVYVPLLRGLDEVAWQIRARQQVDQIVKRLSSRVVQSRVHVERQHIGLTLVLLGSPGEAAALRRELDTQLQEATGVAPKVEVLAVADAQSMVGLQASLREPQPAPLLVEPRPAQTLEGIGQTLRDAIERRWPSRTAGKPLAIALLPDEDQLALQVVHLGAELAPTAIESLERALSDDLMLPLRLHDAALPPNELTADAFEPEFTVQLARWLERARLANQVWLCVSAPGAPASGAATTGDGTGPGAPASPAPSADAGAPAVDATSDALGPPHSPLRILLAGQPRVGFVAGPPGRLQFVAGACSPAAQAPSIATP
jgi:uncharacterized hydrophobic protein (TIGR00271 family)